MSSRRSVSAASLNRCFRRLLLWLVLTAPALAALPIEAPTPQELAQGYRERRILAKPRADRVAAIDDAERSARVHLRRKFSRLGHLRVLDLEENDTADRAIARLRATGRYEYVERDVIRRARVTPNDPLFSQQWGLRNTGQSNGSSGADIDAITGWDTATNASSVIVAVIDSGIRLTHQDLAANLWSSPTGKHGINSLLASNSANYTVPNDDLGHGTHVAGIIGAVGNNGIGVSGVAWNTKLMALKFLAASGGGSASDSIECINYAVENGAKIINASYGESGYSQAEYEAIKDARDAGVIFVAAAGNSSADNDTVPDYPSGYLLDNIVTVSSTTRTDSLASSSSFGSGSVDLAAPGAEVHSTYYTSDSSYTTLSGTSMAAPHVSGALALLKVRFPQDTYRQTINRLLRSVEKRPALAGKVQTGGRLNLANALALPLADNRPFNDEFATRATLSGANVRIRSNNVDATTEPGEPAHAGLGASRTLWWSWTAPETTQMSLDTQGSSYDTVLAVYTGSSVDALQSVASNDNSPAGGTTSRVVTEITAGTTYHIAIGAKTVGGFTTLRIGTVPGNDDFARAKELTGENVRETGTSLNASREFSEPTEPNNAGTGHSVWYRWTAPSTKRYTLAAFATTNDTVAAIYTGTSLASLTLVAANDNSSSQNSDALVPFDAQAGTTYTIAIDNAGSNGTPEGGEFVLTITDSVWQFPALDESTTPPAVAADGTIYFGVGSEDAFDTKVYAVTSSGESKWTYTTGAEGVIGAAPVVASDGTVYIGGTDKIFLALNGNTGAKKWSYTAATEIISSAALGADGTIYFRDNTKLYALTPAGTLKWSTTLAGSTEGTYCSPSIAVNGTIYVGTNGGKFHAFADNGTSAGLKWTHTADGDIYTTPSIGGDGTLYFATLNGTVYALTDNGTSVTEKWSWTTPSNSSITSSIALDGAGSLYFAAYNRRLYALSSAGAEKWSYLLGDEVRASSPAIDANGTVYVGSYDSLLYAVSSTGELVRTFPTARAIRSSPVIAGNRLYFAGADAKLYAFDLAHTAATSPWPMLHRTPAREGRAASGISITTQPLAQQLSTGGAFSLSVGASGTSSIAYQWFKDGQPIAGATSSIYSITAADPSHSGSYSASVTNLSGTITSTAVLVSVVDRSSSSSRIVDLAARGPVGVGENVLIAGVVVSGSPPKSLLVRGVGPGLSALGVANALADPQVHLIPPGSTQAFASNDNWSDPAVTTVGAAVGASPALAVSSKDAALLTSADSATPTVFTAQISGVNNATGVALAEIYDTDISSGARLVAISARCRVGVGESVLIGGFVIAGPTPMRVLIRGVGPALSALGVASALADPQVVLYRHQGGGAEAIADNDNWGDDPAINASSIAVGNTPLLAHGSKDAALIVTLEPGVYSAQVSGVNGATGVALVEIYEVP